MSDEAIYYFSAQTLDEGAIQINESICFGVNQIDKNV